MQLLPATPGARCSKLGHLGTVPVHRTNAHGQLSPLRGSSYSQKVRCLSLQDKLVRLMMCGRKACLGITPNYLVPTPACDCQLHTMHYQYSSQGQLFVVQVCKGRRLCPQINAIAALESPSGFAPAPAKATNRSAELSDPPLVCALVAQS